MLHRQCPEIGKRRKLISAHCRRIGEAAGELVAPKGWNPDLVIRGVGEAFELPRGPTHVGGTTENYPVGSGEGVPSGVIDHPLFVDADDVYLRVGGLGPFAYCLGLPPCVPVLRMSDDGYRYHYGCAPSPGETSTGLRSQTHVDWAIEDSLSLLGRLPQDWPFHVGVQPTRR